MAVARVSAKATETVGTVSRVVRLIRLLAEAPGDVSIGGLSARLELPPSTVHRLLHLLIDEGIAARSEERLLYRPGLDLIRLGALMTQRMRIADVARPIMQAIVDEVDETCMLTQMLPNDYRVTISASIASTNPLRYDHEMFMATSLLRGATGLSIFAFLPPAEIDAAIAAEAASLAGADVDRDALLATCEDIRRKGYVITHGEKIVGAVGIGAPVFDAKGRITAGLCLTMPEHRFDPVKGDQLGALMQENATLLSGAIGHQPRSIST